MCVSQADLFAYVPVDDAAALEGTAWALASELGLARTLLIVQDFISCLTLSGVEPLVATVILLRF